METKTKPSMAMHGASDTIPSTPDQHAFIMLGEKALFLVHMTMFHMDDHCYQMVLRGSLPSGAMETFLRDRRAHPNEPYFLGNDDDDLFTAPSIKTGSRTKFTANIFRGIPYEKEYHEWPWKKERPIVAKTTLAIDRVVYYRHFDFNLSYPRSLTYVLFGSGDEAHMNHYQVKEPDFDQVLSLRRAPSWLPPEDLEAAVHVNFPDRADWAYCSNPVPEGTYHVQYCGQGPLRQIDVGTSWWCSTKVVNANDPCPA